MQFGKAVHPFAKRKFDSQFFPNYGGWEFFIDVLSNVWRGVHVRSNLKLAWGLFPSNLIFSIKRTVRRILAN